MNMAFDPEGAEPVAGLPALAGERVSQGAEGCVAQGTQAPPQDRRNVVPEGTQHTRSQGAGWLVRPGDGHQPQACAEAEDGAAAQVILLPDGAPPAGNILSRFDMAEILFGSAASEMTRLLRRLESGDPIKPKEAADAANETRKALERLQDERNRVEQLRRTLAGGVGDRALDLAAARDEIGRRLACLRDAGGD